MYRKENTTETIRESIVDIATDLLGAPSIRYLNPELGKSPTKGFDCSGFVTFVLSAAGLTIPDYIGQDNIRRPIRHTNEYWDSYGAAVHSGFHESGDLIFFSRNGMFPTHIGIVWDKQKYIHAPGRDNTTVEVAEISEKSIVSKIGNRVLYHTNPIGFKALTAPTDASSYRYHQRVI